MIAEILPPILLHGLGQCAGTHAEIVRCHSYNFYSGELSDVSELSAVGAMVALIAGVWHHVNCDAPGCWRVSKHHYVDKDGKKHKLCHRDDVEPHPKHRWWKKRQGHPLPEIHSRILGSRVHKADYAGKASTK